MRKRILMVGAAGLLAMAATPVFAQGRDFDVTLEVLDDVSDIDAVILTLEDERDELERRESDQRDAERERDSADARADLEREFERDFERDRERELDGREDDRDAVIEDRDIERERDELERELEEEERGTLEVRDTA